MPSIIEEIAQDQMRWKRGDCQTCAWIVRRPEDEQDEWHKALADNSFSTTSIYRAMKRRTPEEGAMPGESSVGKHRRAGHKAGHTR